MADESPRSACPRMVSMSVPDLGVRGPQMMCGAPIPRQHCPFSHDRFTGCPYRTTDDG